jgi:hypothetical protein
MAALRRAGTVATTLAVLAVLVGGCSEPQQANETLPSAAETSDAPALEPLGPPDFPVPDEAREQTEAGAEAFLRYYFALLNRSLDDLDARHLREFSRGCETCDRIAGETESDAEKGYRYSGGELEITSEISSAMTMPGRVESAFITAQAPMTVLDAAGTPVPDLVFEGKPVLNTGTVTVWSDQSSSWFITQLTLG